MDHSKISPSKSERWINCPGSVPLCEKMPPQESSKYADEGTAAHELAAMCLKDGLDADQYLGEVIEVKDSKYKVTEDMAQAVQVYLNAIRTDMANDGVTELAIEHQFSIPDVSAHLYGTNDASYISPFASMLRVYDYKHGQGTYVEVENNSQLLIYALGAWQESGRIAEEIEIVIVQPRYRDADPVRRFKVDKDFLLKFKETLKKAVAIVHAGSTTLKTGDWCKFCQAASVCTAKHKEVFSVIPAGNKAQGLPDPAALTTEQVIKVLKMAEAISDWAAAVHAHAESLAKQGVEVPGYKLVQKKGNRRWVDEVMVETAFESEHGDKIYEKKILSPAKMEKVVGKDAVKEYIEIPDNGVQLVPDTAKGEPIRIDAASVFTKLE